jgi:hypothetical protein
MKRLKTRKMLMNFYGEETYEMNKNMSLESVFKWLAEANRFLLKVKGIDRILSDEKRMREMGW